MSNDTPDIIEATRRASNGDYNSLAQLTPRIVSCYGLQTWIEIATKLLYKYKEKYALIQLRLQPGLSSVLFDDLINDLLTSPYTSIFEYGSSYPYAPLSYSYYQLSASYIKEAVSNRDSPVAWVTSMASFIYASIDCIAYSHWEDLDYRNVLALYIVNYQLDNRFWPDSGTTPSQHLKSSIKFDSSRHHFCNEVWKHILEELGRYPELRTNIGNIEAITFDWINRGMTPLRD
jgi:hypothetical protein